MVSTWESRMAERNRQRQAQAIRHASEATFVRPGGTICYPPGWTPCPTCGYIGSQPEHTCYAPDNYHFPPCACIGDQWCCIGRHDRMRRFLIQKLANNMRAAEKR